MTLLTRVRALFEPFLRELAPDRSKVPDYLAMVKPAANLEHGDYQANFAMALAKAVNRTKEAPQVAREVIDKLPPNELIASATVAGPGFVNLKLKDEFLATSLRGMAADARLGIEPVVKPKTFVIDYSSPNVAKPLHVGHLRSTIIGDALTRLLRFLGHRVITDNHLGDWGTQFGMLLYGYKNLLDRAAYDTDSVRELARLYLAVRKVDETVDILSRGYHEFRDDGQFRTDPIGELARLYVNGLKRLKSGDDEDDDDDRGKKPVPNPVKTAYREETAKLHAGDPENTRLWKEFMPPCMADIHAVYKQLQILSFDHEHGESFYNEMLPEVVKSLVAAGVAEPGEGGSLIVRPDSKNVALVRKRDGAFTYTTTDLATVKYRAETFKPDAVLYVVDFRQGQHFANLFAVAKRWGYTSTEFKHVSFGSVLGKDGKPIKTREGGATELTQLLDRAVELGGRLFELSYWQRKAKGHDVPDWNEFTDEEKRTIADTVGIGAVKYSDLSQNRESDYKFDFDKMLATDGNTATYMQYAYARCRSIFRLGEIDEQKLRASTSAVAVSTPEERALALQVLRFGEALDAAAAENLPHLLTGYLWDLAKAYSRFFEGCPVLKAATPELRNSRLVLVDLTGRVIRQTLDLLGIRTVERM
jgi:arginyl-tRNA synthetase